MRPARGGRRRKGHVGLRRRGPGDLGRHAVVADLLRTRWCRAGRVPAVEPDPAARGHGPRRHRIDGDLRPLGDGPAHRGRRAPGRGLPLLERLGSRVQPGRPQPPVCACAVAIASARARHRGLERVAASGTAARSSTRWRRSSASRSGSRSGRRPRRPGSRSATTSGAAPTGPSTSAATGASRCSPRWHRCSSTRRSPRRCSPVCSSGTPASGSCSRRPVSAGCPTSRRAWTTSG